MAIIPVNNFYHENTSDKLQEQQSIVNLEEVALCFSTIILIVYHIKEMFIPSLGYIRASWIN